MLAINPGLFARLMRLPQAARADILEFLGATPLGDAQLSAVIDSVVEHIRCEPAERCLEQN